MHNLGVLPNTNIRSEIMKLLTEMIDNVKTTFIQSDKFKTIVIKVLFRGKNAHDSATQRSLLSRLLANSTAKYPTKKELTNKLYDLYEASFSVGSSPIYENSIVSFNLEFVNSKYLPDKKVTIEAFEFLHEAIFYPNITKNQFDEKVFQEEKRLLKVSIENIYNNKNRYALRRLLDHMCPDEPSSISPLGDLEVLKNLTSKDLALTYQKMISEDEVSVYCLGDFDIEEMKSYLINNLKIAKLSSKTVNYPLHFNEIRKNITSKEISEEQDINQTKLMIGFRTNTYPTDKLLPALIVFNIMYGGLYVSDLFQVVREKHSLAYEIASQVISEAGLLIVNAGIEKSQINQATSLIINEFRKYQEGRINHELFEVAKTNLLNDLKELEDDPYSIINFIYRRHLFNLSPNVDDYIKQIQNVTLEDVIAVAKNIELDTIYTLTNKAGEHYGA